MNAVSAIERAIRLHFSVFLKNYSRYQHLLYLKVLQSLLQVCHCYWYVTMTTVAHLRPKQDPRLFQ
jgi:hypothetical protein